MKTVKSLLTLAPGDVVNPLQGLSTQDNETWIVITSLVEAEVAQKYRCDPWARAGIFDKNNIVLGVIEFLSSTTEMLTFVVFKTTITSTVINKFGVLVFANDEFIDGMRHETFGELKRETYKFHVIAW